MRRGYGRRCFTGVSPPPPQECVGGQQDGRDVGRDFGRCAGRRGGGVQLPPRSTLADGAGRFARTAVRAAAEPIRQARHTQAPGGFASFIAFRVA